jgi:alkylated DNA repair dioxygenase AlkB
MKDLKDINLKFETHYGSLYAPECVEPEAIIPLRDQLLNLNWETKTTARHEYFMSYDKTDYSYGNKDGNNPNAAVYTSQPFTAGVNLLMIQLNQILGTRFNACFLNKYDNQKQALGWHSDDFPGMRADEPIGVISFGAEREIWVRDKRGFTCQDCEGNGIKRGLVESYQCDKCRGSGWQSEPPDCKQPKEQRIKLKEGSLFLMPIGYQDTHQHRIPKHDRPCGWRISLTFRSFT